MVEVIKLNPNHLEEEALRRIAEVVQQGGVIAYPTDTFYGLGCDPFSESAVERIFSIKGREPGKPIVLIVSELSVLDRLTGERGPLFAAVSRRFWPGPLTIVVPAASTLPSILTADTGTVGIRWPHDDLCCRIVHAGGEVLTGTSANLSGTPSLATAEAVAAQIGAMLDLIVDGGPTAGGQPSTILDLAQGEPKLIREGALPRAQLEQWLGAPLSPRPV
jgi:L-threonylcarbamoyladenylate synthase